MKLIRTISLFIALAVVATVGAVYAQWVYQDSYVNGVSDSVSVPMQEYLNVNCQQGYFTEKYNTLTLCIADDLDALGNPVPAGTAGDYVAELSGNGGLLFLFRPYVDTTEAQMNELKLNIVFGETSSIVYEGARVFDYTPRTGKQLTKLTAGDIATLNAKYAGLALTTDDLGNGAELGLYYLEITFEDMLDEYISFTGAFGAVNKIDTLQKWDKLNAAVRAAQFTVTVSDVRQGA